MISFSNMVPSFEGNFHKTLVEVFLEGWWHLKSLGFLQHGIAGGTLGWPAKQQKSTPQVGSSIQSFVSLLVVCFK